LEKEKGKVKESWDEITKKMRHLGCFDLTLHYSRRGTTGENHRHIELSTQAAKCPCSGLGVELLGEKR